MLFYTGTNRSVIVKDMTTQYDSFVHRITLPYPHLRLLVARELPLSLETMSLQESVHMALPMLQALGNDVEDSVRETFVVELDKIIMYYYRVRFPLYFHQLRDNFNLLGSFFHVNLECFAHHRSGYPAIRHCC